MSAIFNDIEEWELFVRPLIALGLGSLIGLERERVSTQKGRGGAGFRTHVLVAVVRDFAILFTLRISEFGVRLLP